MLLSERNRPPWVDSYGRAEAVADELFTSMKMVLKGE
jgi:hypothetical protein